MLNIFNCSPNIRKLCWFYLQDIHQYIFKGIRFLKECNLCIDFDFKSKLNNQMNNSCKLNMGLQTFEQGIPFYNESQSQVRKDQDKINIQYLLDCILSIPKHS